MVNKGICKVCRKKRRLNSEGICFWCFKRIEQRWMPKLGVNGK